MLHGFILKLYDSSIAEISPYNLFLTFIFSPIDFWTYYV